MANGKPGPPLGSQNHLKHGIYSRNAKHVDMRRRENRVVAQTLTALEADLGGAGDLSVQEKIILGGIGRRLRDLWRIDIYLDTLETIANRKKRALWPIVVQKHAIIDSLHRDLERLGLKRRARELSFEEWLASPPEADRNGTITRPRGDHQTAPDAPVSATAGISGDVAEEPST